MLMRKPVAKQPSGRPGSGCEKNIKEDSREVCYEDGRWTEIPQRAQWQAVVLAVLQQTIC